MKKAKYNKTGTRQLIESGWKLFDNQTNCISTGNVYANTQLSSYVRPWAQTECNGFTNEKGHLTMFDLEPFQKFEIPSVIKEIITDVNRKDSVILYMFFVTNKDKRIEPFCWIVTDRLHNLVKCIVTCAWQENMDKRERAACEVIKYITE